MATYGYIRVSSTDQNDSRQLDAMDALRIPPRNIFSDKQSGKNTARPGLQKLLGEVEDGDTVILVRRWERGNLPTLEALAQTGLKEATFYRRLREWRLSKRK